MTNRQHDKGYEQQLGELSEGAPPGRSAQTHPQTVPTSETAGMPNPTSHTEEATEGSNHTVNED